MPLRDFIDELTRCVQVVRKNAAAEESGALIKAAYSDVYGHHPTEAQLESILSETLPWIFGPKSIMHALLKLTERLPDFQELYNLLTIAKNLDKTRAIDLAWYVYSIPNNSDDINQKAQWLPEPDIRWCMQAVQTQQASW